MAKIKKIKWWHEAIIDYLIANPQTRKISEVADYFGVTPTWMGQIIGSDAFKKRLAERRARHALTISKDTSKRLQELASVGLDLMLQKLESLQDEMAIDPSRVNLKEVRETSEMALNAMGYGGKKGNAVDVRVGVSLIDGQVLARARERMREVVDMRREEEGDAAQTAGALPSHPAEEGLPASLRGSAGRLAYASATLDQDDEGQGGEAAGDSL